MGSTLVLILFALLWSSCVSDSKIGLIVDNFNAYKFERIYSEFDLELRKDISQNSFVQKMTATRDSLGLIEDYVLLDAGQLFFICEKNLDTGVFFYKVNKYNLIAKFLMEYSPTSTFKYLFQNRANPKNSLAFSTVHYNYSLNADTNLSLCSVYKITLILEYSRQVVAGKVNATECVPLDVVNKYLAPHIDSGHNMWLQGLDKSCATNQQMIVAMIRYSSNAIAEYVTDLLTPQKIDKLISQLQMNHSQTLYVVSSMLALNNTDNLPRPEYLAKLRSLTESDLCNLSFTVHQQLNSRELNLSSDSFYLDPEIIDIHVQLLERSSARQYYQLMQKVNAGIFFEDQELNTIKMLFDQVDRVSNFSVQSFVHAGTKGGSANYPGMKNTALAVAGYSQQNDNIRCSYAMLLNGMDTHTFQQRLLDLNLFILAVETSEYYVVQFTRRMNRSNLREVIQ